MILSGLFSSAVSSVVPKKWIIVIISAIFIGLYIYILKKDIDDLNDKIAQKESTISTLNSNIDILEANIKTQQSSLELLRSNFDDINKINSSLRTEISAIKEQNDSITNTYNSYRSRMHELTVKKPNLIERRVNSATIDLMHKFESTTDKNTTEQ